MFDVSDRVITETRRLFTYKPGLVVTGGNFLYAMAQVPEGFEASGMRHEYRIIRQMREDGSPLSYMPYSEVFGIGNSGPQARLMLSTRLRVPRGQDPEKYETRGGRRYWRRVLVEGDNEMDAMVPESGAVYQFGRESCLPEVTGPPAESLYPFSVRFEFRPLKHDSVLVIKSAEQDTDKGLVIEATRSTRHKHDDNSVRLVRDLV